MKQQRGLVVTFLGTGDASGSGGRFHACILVEAEDACFLLDCGASSVIALNRYHINANRVGAILVSHLHGDHFGGIPFFLMDAICVTGRTTPLAIAGPEGVEDRVWRALDVLYAGVSERERAFPLRFEELTPGKGSSLGAVSVIPGRGSHGRENALVLRVECGGKVIAYSGDTGWTDALKEAAAGADLFICEASHFEKEKEGHLTYRTLARRRADLECKRMVLTHLGSDVLARTSDLDIETVEDGERIVL